MKQNGKISGVPSFAITLSSIVLGVLIAGRFAPGTLAFKSQSVALGFTLLQIVEIGVFVLIVTGLHVLKSRSDRQYEIERELLEAFLEHIPDNVFFKDQDSRFVRISRAMASY